MKSYFENAINELDKGNMVEVHKQLELAEIQLDTIPQIQALEPQGEASQQEDEGYEAGFENENEEEVIIIK